MQRLQLVMFIKNTMQAAGQDASLLDPEALEQREDTNLYFD